MSLVDRNSSADLYGIERERGRCSAASCYHITGSSGKKKSVDTRNNSRTPPRHWDEIGAFQLPAYKERRPTLHGERLKCWSVVKVSTTNGLKWEPSRSMGVGIHNSYSWVLSESVSFFFSSRTFPLQEVYNILLIYWQSPARAFLYRWLWMCMNDTAKSKPQLLRSGLGDGW